MSHFAFVDSCHRKDHVIAIGCILVPCDRLPVVEAKIEEKLVDLGFPAADFTQLNGVELKWNDNKDSLWRGLNLEGYGNDKHLAKADLLKIAIDHNCEPLYSAVHYGETRQSQEEASEQAIKMLLEVIEENMERANSTAFVASDADGSKDDQRDMIKEHFELVRNGTEYRELSKIHRYMWQVDSCHSYGVQLADLVAGITCDATCEISEYGLPAYDTALKGKFLLNRHLELTHPQRFGVSILPSTLRKELVSKMSFYTKPFEIIE